MIDIKAERERVATAIRAAVPEKWTVYAAPPDTEVLPCIVVAAGTTYLERVSFADWEVSLRLLLMQQVAAGGVALDVMDSALAEVIPALLLVEDIRLLRVEGPALQTRAGVPAIVASIPIAI